MLEKILATAKKKGISQSALERAAGLPAARIAKWKSGVGEPSWSEAVRLCEAVGIHVNDLVDNPLPPPLVLSDDERALLMLVRGMGVERVIRKLTAPLLELEPQSRESGSANSTK